MGVFAYRALDARERPIHGTLTADTPAEARQQLRARGLAIAELAPLGPPRRWNWIASRRARLRPAQRAEIWRSLAVLLLAGVPLATALQTCRQELRGAAESALRRLEDAIRGGRNLAEALRAQPELGDELAQTIVQVGLHTGQLGPALQQLAEYLLARRQTADKLTTALIYPAILCSVGLGVVLFLATQVLPQLLEVLASAGRSLPWPTRVLQAISAGLLQYGIVLAGIVAIAVVVIGATWHAPHLQRLRERAVLRLPVYGGLVRTAWLARIAGLLALLLRVDVRFTTALALLRRSLPHRLYAEALERLEKALEAGVEIAAPLRGSRLIPPLVTQLLALGQASGELPAMLEQLRAHYERELSLATARFLALLEPMLILVLALLIGFVVFATLLPILEATKVVG